VAYQSGLGRTVVVRRDDEQRVRAHLLRGAGEFGAVVRVVGAHAGDHPGPVADRLDHGAEQALLFGITRGGRLARGSADHEGVVALLVDEVRRQRGRAVGVQRAVRPERRHHRGDQAAKWPPGVICQRHDNNLA
jgi:hypothetical protein